MQSPIKILQDLYYEFCVEKPARVTSDVLTWPNVVTFLGIIGVIFYIYQFIFDSLVWLIPIMIFLVAFSDILDGWLARKLDQHTHLGKILDPLRDRIMRYAMVVNIYIMNTAESLGLPIVLWVVCELSIMVLDNWCKYKNISIKVHTIRKIRQGVFFITIGAVLTEYYWFDTAIIPIAGTLWVLVAMSAFCLVTFLCDPTFRREITR